MEEYLGEVGLILLFLLLIIIFIPIIIGMFLATIIRVSGIGFCGVVGLVAIAFWIVMVLYFCNVL